MDALRRAQRRGASGAAEPQPGAQNREQVDVHDRHPVFRKPGPREGTKETGAIRRRQIHQDMTGHADNRDGAQRAERSRRIGALRIPPAQADPDKCGDDQSDADDAQGAVGRSAMPSEVGRRAAGGRHDVDVRSIRCEKNGNRRASSAAAERRPRQRQAEEAVRQVVQST